MTEIIALSDLHVSKLNARPRKKLKAIPVLATDIQANGLLHPLVVRAEGEGFGILAGQRRYEALKHLAKIDPDITVECNVSKSMMHRPDQYH